MIEKKAYIFGSIFILANKLQNLGDKTFQNITTKQWLLIAALYKAPSDQATLTSLAKTIGSSRQNVKQLALNLEREGLIELKNNSKDARSLLVVPTTYCDEIFKSREEKENEFVENVFKDFKENEIVNLFDAMSKLTVNIYDMEENLYEK